MIYNKFFDSILHTLKELDYDQVKCLIIASPGNIKNELLSYVKELAKTNKDAS